MIISFPRNPVSKVIGFCKDKTFKLQEIKNAKIRKANRFRKHFEPISVLNEKGNDQEALLLGKNKSDTVIEMFPIQQPSWVTLYNQIQKTLKQAQKISNELEKDMAERILHQFRDNSRLDREITRKSKEAFNLLRDCEKNLKRISLEEVKEEKIGDAQVRKNIEKSLAQEISEMIIQFQKQEKRFLEKLKAQGSYILDNVLEPEPLDEDLEEQKQEVDEVEHITKQRNEQIDAIVGSITELSKMFRQLNTLVIEQGSIIDRIDYNLETAESHLFKGKDQLVKGKHHMKEGFADRVIKVLYTLIIIFTILLAIKYSHRN